MQVNPVGSNSQSEAEVPWRKGVKPSDLQAQTHAIAKERLGVPPGQSVESEKAQKLQGKIQVLNTQMEQVINQRYLAVSSQLNAVKADIAKTHAAIKDSKEQLATLKKSDEFRAAAWNVFSEKSQAIAYKMEKNITDKWAKLENLLETLQKEKQVIQKEFKVIHREMAKVKEALARKELSLRREIDPSLKPSSFTIFKEKIAKVGRKILNVFQPKVDLLRLAERLEPKKKELELRANLQKSEINNEGLIHVAEKLCGIKVDTSLAHIKLDGVTLKSEDGTEILVPEVFAEDAKRKNYKIKSSSDGVEREYTFASKEKINPELKKANFLDFLNKLDQIFGDKFSMIAPLLTQANEADLAKLVNDYEGVKYPHHTIDYRPTFLPLEILEDKGNITIISKISGNTFDRNNPEGPPLGGAEASRKIEFNLNDLSLGASVQQIAQKIRVTDILM